MNDSKIIFAAILNDAEQEMRRQERTAVSTEQYLVIRDRNDRKRQQMARLRADLLRYAPEKPCRSPDWCSADGCRGCDKKNAIIVAPTPDAMPLGLVPGFDVV